MHNSNEKIWFVYMGNHHEGPFSFDEIKTQVSTGALDIESYIWKEGMPDWKTMGEVTDFKPVLQADLSGSKLSAPMNPPQVTNGGGSRSALEKKQADLQTMTEKLSQNQTSLEIPAEALPTEEVTGSFEVTRSQSSLGAIKLEDDIPEIHSPQHTRRMEPTPIKEPSTGSSGWQTSTLSENISDDHRAVVIDKGPLEPTGIPEPAPTIASKAKSFFTRKPKNETHPDVYREPKVLPIKLILSLGIAGIAYLVLTGKLDFVGGLKEAIWPAVENVATKVPFLEKWFSPIPVLTDVAQEDYLRLKKAAGTPLQEGGAQYELALVVTDPKQPSFYVGTNLPDQTKFEIVVEGLPDSLLNHFEAKSKSQVTITERLGKSAPLTFKAGEPLPAGQYHVFLFESSAQPDETRQYLLTLPVSNLKLPEGVPSGKKLIQVKPYFLGGVNDTNYKVRLEKFHSEVRKKANEELMSLTQLGQELFRQYNDTIKSYDQYSRLMSNKKKSKAALKDWKAFHEKWSKIPAQMDSEFAALTADRIKDKFFPPLYEIVKKSREGVMKVHSVHHQFFTSKNINKAVYQSDLRRSRDEAKATLIQYRDRLDKVKAEQPQTGLPKKMR